MHRRLRVPPILLVLIAPLACIAPACTSDTTTPTDDEVGDSDDETTSGEPTSSGDSSDESTGCVDGCECVTDVDCDPGETCEAGSCVPIGEQPECGNSIVERGEECDAGAQNGPGQACLADCVINVCGDGDPGPGEGCDDGNDVDDDTCTNACVLTSCGDGVVAAQEECDDGNLVEDDACTNACTLPICGDSIMSAGEACDEGAANSDHADCTGDCQVAICGDGLLHDDGMGDEQCDLAGSNGPGQSCLDGCVLNVCGDGDLGPGESCDDGNLVGGDGCSGVCVLESCGNAIIDPGEGCDDGNAVNDDECTNACNLPICGDTIIQAGEACDLGNLNSNAGACTLGCTVAQCGDGLIWDGQEQCDEGANNANDGACKLDCSDQICGDGFVGLDEGCDDGNMVADDECTNACKLPECGDSIVQAGEQCDQGPNNGMGQCSLTCTIPSCGCGEYHDTPYTCADLYPNIIFVKQNGVGGGSCWDDAMALLPALAIAGPGDALWVMASTYKPGPANDRTTSFVIPSGVSVYGGFAGVETALAQRNWTVNPTILSGDIDGNGYTTTAQAQLDSYHVVRIPNGNGVRLDGVRIRGGFADGAGEDTAGGGIYITSGNPTIANSILEYNHSVDRGRAIQVAAGSPQMSATSLLNNQLASLYTNGGALGVASGAVLDVTGGTFTSSSLSGLAWVDVGGSLALTNMTGTWTGRGAQVFGGALTLTNCDFQNGTVAVLQGGSLEVLGGSFGPGPQALSVQDAVLNIEGATFAGHSLPTEGGAIYANNSTVTIADSHFENNAVNTSKAGHVGGAIYLWYSDLEIADSTFVGNTGGWSALYSRGGTSLVQSCHFQDNVQAGGVTMRSGSLTLLDSTFIGNERSGAYNSESTSSIRNCRFESNSEPQIGGGIRSSGPLDVENCVLIGNSASSGGGIGHQDLYAGQVRVHSTLFIGNAATNAGGGLRSDESPTELVNCLFSGNTAGVRGGGVLGVQGHVVIHDSSFTGNTSPEGGALTSVLSQFEVYNSVFWADSSVIFEDAPVSKTFAYVCSPTVLAGTANVTIAATPYVNAAGVDAMIGTEDDDLHLGGMSCTEAGNPALRPTDTLDLDGDGNTAELIPLDLDGGARIQGPTMERGAFED